MTPRQSWFLKRLGADATAHLDMPIEEASVWIECKLEQKNAGSYPEWAKQAIAGRMHVSRAEFEAAGFVVGDPLISVANVPMELIHKDQRSAEYVYVSHDGLIMFVGS